MSQIREQRSTVSGQRSEISGHIREIPHREVADPSSTLSAPSSTTPSSHRGVGSSGPDAVVGPPVLSVALVTGGGDKPYALGLAAALTSAEVSLDFIGSDDLNVPELLDNPRVNFLNLRGDQRPKVSLAMKSARVLVYYWRLIRYAATAQPKLF